jgi:nitrite reductase/ring-hydroxylating ferredoxin subunit
MRAARETVLCRLDDIPAPGSRGFTLGQGVEAEEFFIVRDETGVYAYENNCPHRGGLLDWTPDRFLTRDKTHILCATHGAVFRMNDGFCVGGPCVGKSLSPVAITVRDGDVVVGG